MYECWKSSVFIQSTIQNISAEKYGNLVVPTPSTEIQSQIVEDARRKTDAIERLKADAIREIELIEEFRTSLIAEAVTGKIDVSRGASK